jgi:hypothetical protein
MLAGDVDRDRRSETLLLLDWSGRRELAGQLAVGAVLPALGLRSLAPIAVVDFHDDDQCDQKEHEAEVGPVHAAWPLTTPSRTAIRRAAAAPELRGR